MKRIALIGLVLLLSIQLLSAETSYIDALVNESTILEVGLVDNLTIAAITLDGWVERKGFIGVYLEVSEEQHIIYERIFLPNAQAQPVLEEPRYENSSDVLSLVLDYYTINDTVLIDDAIGVTVENSKVNASEENLCTLWTVQPAETIACHGSAECCEFASVPASNSRWDAPYFIAKHEAAHENDVSAQLLHVDVNLSVENPHATIHKTETLTLGVDFYNERLYLEEECRHTCEFAADSTNATIQVLLENSSLYVDSIQVVYAEPVFENTAPELVRNFSDIAITKGEKVALNVGNYFSDDDSLTFSAFNTSLVAVEIINDTALIELTSEGEGYLFFIATDGEYATSSNVFTVKQKSFDTVIKSLRSLIGI